MSQKKLKGEVVRVQENTEKLERTEKGDKAEERGGLVSKEKVDEIVKKNLKRMKKKEEEE